MINDEIAVKTASWEKIFNLPKDLKISIKDARKLAWVMSDWATHSIVLEEFNWLFFISFNESRGKNLVWLLNEEWIILKKYDWFEFKDKPFLLKDWTLVFEVDDNPSWTAYSTNVEEYTSDLTILWKWFFKIDNRQFYNKNINNLISNVPIWWLNIKYLLEWSELIKEIWDDFILNGKKFKKRLIWI